MKGKIIYTVAIGLLFFSSSMIAQTENNSDDYIYEEDYYYEEEKEDLFFSRQTEIGLDFTPLISKLIPFNLSSTETGVVGLKYKRYKRTHAFRINAGANLNDSRNDVSNFFYFSLGYEKRKVIAPKWSYITGWEFVSFFEESNSFRDESFVGISKFFGFEFNISDNIFLSTEANILLVWSDDDAKIQFNVPQSIFFLVRF